MSKAGQFMTSLEQHHLVVNVKAAEDPLDSFVREALRQFNFQRIGQAWVAAGDNALELRPLRGVVNGLPPPFAAPMPQPDANDGTVLLVLAVPTSAETDSY
jgi:hypothetical protein